MSKEILGIGILVTLVFLYMMWKAPKTCRLSSTQKAALMAAEKEAAVPINKSCVSCLRLVGTPENNWLYATGPYHNNVVPGYRGVSYDNPDHVSVTGDPVAGVIVPDPFACQNLCCSLPDCEGINYYTKTRRCIPILQVKEQLIPNATYEEVLSFRKNLCEQDNGCWWKYPP